MALMFPTVTIVLNVSSVAAIWIGANRISSGDLSVGALIAFLSYLAQILLAVMMATFMAVLVPRATVCAERIQEVLDTESSVVAPIRAGHRAAVACRGRAPRRRASPTRAPTNRCSPASRCESRAGQTTAIIGSTGAGKTTLLNLIPRLFDVTSGAVLVDGVDVRELEPELLWGRIGLVPQRPYLFTGTVASNLRYGKPDATDAEVWEALEIAQAARLRAPPCRAGSTRRSSRAAPTCPGASASAWPSPAPSCAGPRSTCSTTRSRRSTWPPMPGCGRRSAPYTADATILVVAQRVSTIATADQILVLEDGRTVGLGTHDELLETCPTYAEIVASQLSSRGRGMSDDGSSDEPVRGEDAPARGRDQGEGSASGRDELGGTSRSRSR